MYKYPIIILLHWICMVPMLAQSGALIAPANTKTPLNEVEQIIFPELDNQQLSEQEIAQREKGRPPQFATAFEVDITPKSHGNWETLPNGKVVWRLRLLSKDAYSLNLGFTNYFMPLGGHLILYHPREKRVLGPFTPMDNETHEQLWTPIVEGDELVIEVVLPVEKRKALELRLTAVNHDFMNFLEMQVGSCNLDVICGAENGSPLNDNYRDIMQSVALYGFNGTSICTGFLVNNTENNCRPYFMTAAHCNITSNNAPTVVVYWNFQNSFCRDVGSQVNTLEGNGSKNVFNSGSTLLADYAPSDMTLVELDDEVPDEANAFLAGWDNRRIAPTDTLITIHHPGALEKRISYAFQNTNFAFWTPGDSPRTSDNGDHIIVPRWDVGTTEDGSSGAPLFNKRKRIVGQLDGGAANCNFRSYDAFGAFTNSFIGGNTVSTRLQDYLDPINSGLPFIDGRWNNACSFFINPEILEQSVCAPDQTTFSFAVSEVFAEALSVSISDLPDGMEANFDKTVVLGGDRIVLTINVGAEVPSDSYPLVVSVKGATSSAETTIFVKVTNSIPKATSLVMPANFSDGLVNQVQFEWEATSDPISTYEFQLSQDSTFKSVEFEEEGLVESNVTYGVQFNTRYFWRVRIINSCGESPWSSIFSFSTVNVSCNVFTYEGDAVIISNRETSIVEAAIDITAPGEIVSIQLTNLDVQHSYVGDLSAKLIAPNGEEVILFDRPGLPGAIFGCSGNDLLLSFEDRAALSNTLLEATCSNAPAITGNFQPTTPFEDLNIEAATGTWRLVIEDASPQDGGQLNGWELSLCTTLPNGIFLGVDSRQKSICEASAVDFLLDIGPDFDDAGVELSVDALPEGVNAFFSNNPASPGETITLSLDGISSGESFSFEVNAKDSTYSYLLTLTVESVSLLAIPEQVYPGDDQLVGISSSLFSWESLPGVEEFEIIIFRDSMQTDTIFNTRVNGESNEIEVPLNPGVYSWQLIARNACGEVRSGLNLFTVSTTSTRTQAAVDVKLYPNPTYNFLTIDFGNQQFQDVRWLIRTLNGQIVSTGQEKTASLWTIPTADLTNGIYILELHHKDFIRLERVVKQ